ncbi:MAG: FeoA domain-containing protein [Mycoplasmataceae bacterium]|jgi:Fe2+ transport system protein FeoA|nr:FeoA domain-containing protein [Mycoplasmataceae bacterium]
MQLSYRLKGKVVKVTDVNFQDQHILHKLNNIGVSKGTILKILNNNKGNNLLHLLIYGVEYVLRAKDCEYINVKEYKDFK